MADHETRGPAGDALKRNDAERPDAEEPEHVRQRALTRAVAPQPFFWSGASFIVAFIISLIKIKRIVPGVARRVACLYRPARAEKTPAGPG